VNSLLARYIDGELDDHEAREFLDAVERDPELAEELRRTEELLAAAAETNASTTPPAFVDAVMNRIDREEVRAAATERSQRREVPAWLRPLAAAAVLALVFVGGMQVGDTDVSDSGTTTLGTTSGITSDDTTPTITTTSDEATTTVATSTRNLHTVRLVYVPEEDQDPDRVHVAGDFNAWDDASTPMRRVGDVWTTTLVLPPGEYEYMFVENGDRWVSDPLALRERPDGFGGTNAVLDVGV